MSYGGCSLAGRNITSCCFPLTSCARVSLICCGCDAHSGAVSYHNSNRMTFKRIRKRSRGRGESRGRDTQTHPLSSPLFTRSVPSELSGRQLAQHCVCTNQCERGSQWPNGLALLAFDHSLHRRSQGRTRLPRGHFSTRALGKRDRETGRERCCVCLCVCPSLSLPLPLSLPLSFSFSLSASFFLSLSLCLCVCLSFPVMRQPVARDVWALFFIAAYLLPKCVCSFS